VARIHGNEPASSCGIDVVVFSILVYAALASLPIAPRGCWANTPGNPVHKGGEHDRSGSARIVNTAPCQFGGAEVTLRQLGKPASAGVLQALI
jgi:hypothetical protein